MHFLKEYWEKNFKNKSLVTILFGLVLALIVKFCWPIALNVISTATGNKIIGLSESEKEINHLVTEAEGKSLTGKNCRYLCDIAATETILGPLILQAPPSEKIKLRIYVQCYQKKRDSLDKIKEIHDLEKDLRQTNTFDAALRFKKYAPTLDDFDIELQPEKVRQAQQILQTTSDNERSINSLIQDTSIDFIKSCRKTITDCSALDSTYSKFKTGFNHYYSDTDPVKFLEQNIQDCIQNCHDKQQSRLATNPTPSITPQIPTPATPQNPLSIYSSTDHTDTPKNKPLLRVTVRKNIDLTKTANRFGDVIMHMNGGETVTVLKESPTGWSFVKYEDKEGYLPNDILLERKQ